MDGPHSSRAPGESDPQENLRIAERAIVAFNERDVETFCALTSADFRWFPSMIAVEAESFSGEAGIRRYFEQLGGAWEYFHVVPDGYRVQPDAVLAIARLEGRGLGSGAIVDSPLGMAFDLRGALITRIRGYLDHGEALRAVGLAD